MGPYFPNQKPCDYCGCYYPDVLKLRDVWVDGNKLLREMNCLNHGDSSYIVAEMGCGHYQVGVLEVGCEREDMPRARVEAHARFARKLEYAENADVIANSLELMRRIFLLEAVHEMTNHHNRKTGGSVIIKVSPTIEEFIDDTYSPNDQSLRDAILGMDGVVGIQLDPQAKGYAIHTEVSHPRTKET